MPLLWLASLWSVKSGRLTIHKENMKGLKPPFLVLGSHQAFMDFPVSQLALFPHRVNYISELEGFEAYGEWLYRQIGCLGTRKFISDLNLIRNIKRVMERKGVLVLYPEARYTNVGTNSTLPLSVYKLIKLLRVPVVTLNMKGNYLQSPIWNLSVRKGVKLDATLTQLLTTKEVDELSLKEIETRIQASLTYDEYQYQYENKMKISYAKRAEGLEFPLYQCKCCKQEFGMMGSGISLLCKNCGKSWIMNELGRLEENAQESIHIPDWYEWERKEVIQEIEAGNYHLDCRVRVEALPNAKNFIMLGEGRLQHDERGFALTLVPYKEKTADKYIFPFSIRRRF